MQNLPNHFIHAETLADTYLADIAQIRQLLATGAITASQAKLQSLETAMQTTLALGELYDLDRQAIN